MTRRISPRAFALPQPPRLRFSAFENPPMRTLLCLLVLSFLAVADDAPRVSKWNGFDKLDFVLIGHEATIVKPTSAAPGKPWIWRTEFFGHEPQGDIALLNAG